MYQYREGKVKSTPSRGVKETLKPFAYKRSEHLCDVTACLLHNEPTSCRNVARLSETTHAAVAKASLKRAKESLAADAKPSDLHMGRVKSR